MTDFHKQQAVVIQAHGEHRKIGFYRRYRTISFLRRSARTSLPLLEARVVLSPHTLLVEDYGNHCYAFYLDDFDVSGCSLLELRYEEYEKILIKKKARLIHAISSGHVRSAFQVRKTSLLPHASILAEN